MNERDHQKLMSMMRPMISKLKQQRINKADPKFYQGGTLKGDKIISAAEQNRAKWKEELRVMSPQDKDKMNQRAKDLEPHVAAGMLTKDEMWPGKDEQALQDNVQQQLKRDQDPVYQAKVTELKDLRRRMDPDNPNAGNVEYLRSSKYKSKGAEASKLTQWS